MPGKRNVNLTHRALKDLRALPPTIAAAIQANLDKLIDNPLLGKPLKGELAGQRRLRVGRYRIVYVFDAHTVHVLTIGDRKEVY
jgi:mRNA interferase RelE/StbE